MNYKLEPHFHVFLQDPHLGIFRVEHDRHGCVHSMAPASKLQPSPPSLQQARLTELLKESLTGHGMPFSVPMYFDGTPLMQAVWKALMRVPRGETITNKKLSELAGYPHGQRSVANAVAANKFAFLVPCHRVVDQDGMAGFRWGSELKKAWLGAEAAA